MNAKVKNPTVVLRVTSLASDLPASERYCTCCKRPLKATAAWLELDTATGVYTQDGTVKLSQGWFPFGMTCARAAITKAKGGAA